MKVKSVLKYVASALLLPAAGLTVLHSASQFSPALADTASASSAYLAQNAPTQTKKEWGNRGEKMFQELNLTADQQAQIKAIKDQSKTSSEGLHQQLKTAHEQLKTRMASNDTNDNALLESHRQLQTLSQQLSEQRFESMLKVRAILTPEQRAKLAELQKQGGQRDRHRQAPAAAGTAS